MNKLFSIHSVQALEKKEYSLVHANVANTDEKIALARYLFPEKDKWHFEFHDVKHDLTPVIFGPCTT